MADFIKDDFLSDGNGQITTGATSLPDPVALETQEEQLESNQNERDALDEVGDYEGPSGMSVQDETQTSARVSTSASARVSASASARARASIRVRASQRVSESDRASE